jgi:RNA polymerase sigma factor (sigma-70 family)
MRTASLDKKNAWLEDLVRAFEGRLVRYCGRFVKSEVARELVQESFVRLWSSHSPALIGREREWLFCVCRNLAIDHLRRERKVVLLNEEGVLVPQVEEALALQESASELQAAIARLPAGQREVVRLKFQEGLSYQEISGITGHSISYVGVLIHQAMESLRKQLAGAASK